MPVLERPFAAAIIVGAGQGTRFGAADKVMAPLAGRPVLAYAIDVAQTAASVNAIVVVAGAHLLDSVVEMAEHSPWSKLVAVVPGGDRRQDSVAAGLAAVPAQTEFVAVHDAARPLATPELFDHCFSAAYESGAAIAAIPVSDTLKRVEGTRIVQTVSREGLWAAQTPQCFRLQLLQRAFALADERGLQATDDAALIEALDLPVTIVPGSQMNLKITRRQDLSLAEALLARQSIPGWSGE